MLGFMERSTIHYLKQKGWTNSQIAMAVGCHRDTVRRILRETVDHGAEPRQRTSQIEVFEAAINRWLDENLSVRRMLEMARSHPDHPYQGGDSAFYDFVQPLRQARTLHAAEIAVRFEGLPGELLQIDWGEERNFRFTKAALAGQTRYFFAARLKYSRWMFVCFTHNMREETLLRCIIACFVELGGVPWAVTSDNMKTITLGRDAHNQPIWHPAFQKFAAEFGFHPSLCAPRAANQKGTVENLVKFVQRQLPGRTPLLRRPGSGAAEPGVVAHGQRSAQERRHGTDSGPASGRGTSPLRPAAGVGRRLRFLRQRAGEPRKPGQHRNQPLLGAHLPERTHPHRPHPCGAHRPL